MPLLKRVSLAALIEHAGVDKSKVPVSSLAQGGHWAICTPTTGEKESFTNSRLAESIRAFVDDNEKRANFLTMTTALYNAAKQRDYQSVMRGSIVDCKVAHDFRFKNATQKIWELKRGKKDRVYFFSLEIEKQSALVLVQAFHKKDQSTPTKVCNFCETTMRDFIDPTDEVIFC